MGGWPHTWYICRWEILSLTDNKAYMQIDGQTDKWEGGLTLGTCGKDGQTVKWEVGHVTR